MPTTRPPSTSWIASVTRPAGFVKLTNQAFGARSATASRQVEHHRHRAEREADAAGPGRLLADDALVERHALVDDAALELADADRAEDEVGALERVVEPGRRTERKLLAALPLEAFEHGRDLREPPLVDVVERDLLEPERSARASSAP